jgi:hypothetical protein
MLRVKIKETVVRWEAVPSDFEQLGGSPGSAGLWPARSYAGQRPALPDYFRSRSLIAELLLNEFSLACDTLSPYKAISGNSFARQKDRRI